MTSFRPCSEGRTECPETCLSSAVRGHRRLPLGGGNPPRRESPTAGRSRWEEQIPGDLLRVLPLYGQVQFGPDREKARSQARPGANASRNAGARNVVAEARPRDGSGSATGGPTERLDVAPWEASAGGPVRAHGPMVAQLPAKAPPAGSGAAAAGPTQQFHVVPQEPLAEGPVRAHGAAAQLPARAPPAGPSAAAGRPTQQFHVAPRRGSAGDPVRVHEVPWPWPRRAACCHQTRPVRPPRVASRTGAAAAGADALPGSRRTLVGMEQSRSEPPSAPIRYAAPGP